jgi:hypothetical protein
MNYYICFYAPNLYKGLIRNNDQELLFLYQNIKKIVILKYSCRNWIRNVLNLTGNKFGIVSKIEFI